MEFGEWKPGSVLEKQGRGIYEEKKVRGQEI